MKPRRFVIFTALLLLLCAAGWLAGCGVPGTTPTTSSLHKPAVGKIVAIEGPDVTVAGRPARIDMQIYANQEVRTGAGSEVTIRLLNGAVLHVYENTDPIFDIIREPLCLLIRMFCGEAMLDTNGACVETETPESNAFIDSVIYIRVLPGRTIYQVYRGQIRVAAREIPGIRQPLSAGQAIEVVPARILPPKRLTPRRMNDLLERYERLLFPLPNWVGRPLEEVRVELEKLGLRADIRETRERRGKPGTVIKQKPGPGTKVRRGNGIHLDVEAAGAPPAIILPRFRGRPLREVERELRELGLRWKIENMRTRKYRPGTVIEQEPGAGRKIHRGDTVHLVVATEGAPAVIHVPRLEGRPLVEVERELRKLGLRWKTETVRTRKYKPGIVVKQEPAAGSEVRKGDTVRLIVETEGKISPPSSIKIY